MNSAKLFALMASIGLPASGSGMEPLEVPLWPNAAGSPTAEGAYEQRGDAARSNRWLTGVTNPIATVYPAASAADGTSAACVVFPGGGYGGLAIDKEGHFVGNWLSQRGVTAMVVPYRCGGGAHQHPVPLADARRAIRLVRAHAEQWRVDPQRVGVLGFSAGGHLAATAATCFADGLDGVEDPLDAVSPRPDFAVLVYPVISMRRGVGHAGSRGNLLGQDPTDDAIAHLSADERVSRSTPPTLLIHSIDDQSVPVENSQRFYEACRRAGVSVEMHLYEQGGHGYGMWAPKGSITTWPDTLQAWLIAKGISPTTKPQPPR